MCCAPNVYMFVYILIETTVVPLICFLSCSRLLSLIEQYRISWLCGQLPHGLNDSLLTLSSMLTQFVPDAAHNNHTQPS